MLHRLTTAWRRKMILGRPGWIDRKCIKRERIVLGADINGHVGKENIGQGWATPGTRTELGTHTLLSGTRARPQRQDPSSFK